MSNETQLKNFLNNNDIKVQSVKRGNVLGTDCYLIYTYKNYTHAYLRKQLGDIKIYRVPKLQGACDNVFIIEAKDGHELLKGCNFNFFDVLGESNCEELIKNQLIIHGSGNKDTRVIFKKGNMVLLYNTKYSSSCIANALNICDDSVVDVSANNCGDLKMVILLDRVNNSWVNKPIPKIEWVDNFDLKKDALDMDNPFSCIRKQLTKNCISCGVIEMNSDNIIRLSAIANNDDIATALNIPTKSIVDMGGKKYILLDRVFRKVIPKECDFDD